MDEQQTDINLGYRWGLEPVRTMFRLRNWPGDWRVTMRYIGKWLWRWLASRGCHRCAWCAHVSRFCMLHLYHLDVWMCRSCQRKRLRWGTAMGKRARLLV